MIRDKILNQLVDKQTALFLSENSTMAQREDALTKIEKRQKELKRLNKDEGDI